MRHEAGAGCRCRGRVEEPNRSACVFHAQLRRPGHPSLLNTGPGATVDTVASVAHEGSTQVSGAADGKTLDRRRVRSPTLLLSRAPRDGRVGRDGRIPGQEANLSWRRTMRRVAPRVWRS